MPFRTWILIPLLCIVIHVLAAPAASVGPVGDGFVFDGAIMEWAKQRHTLALIPKGPGARTGDIWSAQSKAGLVIAGKIKGPPPVFAKTAQDMPNGDHVEVWIALANAIPLPPVGWYNKFGEAGPEDEDSLFSSDPAKKAAWLAEQQRYRRQFLRLFVRQWQLAPDVAVETYAWPAFAALPESDDLHALAPRGQPLTRFTTAAFGYAFEVLIPWEILPPSDRLNLTDLRVLVDVFSPGAVGRYGPFSTTSPTRVYGKVETLNHLALNPPRHWRLPCDVPLEGYNVWGRLALGGSWQFSPGGLAETESLPFKSERLPAYFLPRSAAEIHDIFVIDNELTGFHEVPDRSPGISTTSLFSLELGLETSACGPELAVRRGKMLTRSRRLGIAPETRFRSVTGGWLLAVGPTTDLASPTAEGYCGACEETRMEMFFVPSTNAPPRPAFRKSWGAECECCTPEPGGCDPEIRLADDFLSLEIKVTAEDETTGRADRTRTRYCFQAATHTFIECGKPAVPVAPTDEAASPGGSEAGQPSHAP